MLKNAELALLVAHVFWQFDPSTRDVLEYSKDTQSWIEAISPYPVEGNEYKIPIPLTADRKFFRVKREWGIPLTYHSIWKNNPVPASVATGMPIEVGVTFRVDVPGRITALRFYKHPSNTGMHVARLWRSDGEVLLAQQVFDNETAFGWQQVDLTQSVTVEPGKVYIASYHSRNGVYSYDSGYFTVPLDSPPIRVPVNGGVFSYAGVMPDQSVNANNYWVDPVFVPAQFKVQFRLNLR